MPYCLIWAVTAALLLPCIISLDGTHLCAQVVKGFLCCAEERKGQASLSWDSEFMDLGVQLHKKERTVALVISELPPQPDIGWFGKFIIC